MWILAQPEEFGAAIDHAHLHLEDDRDLSGRCIADSDVGLERWSTTLPTYGRLQEARPAEAPICQLHGSLALGSEVAVAAEYIDEHQLRRVSMQC